MVIPVSTSKNRIIDENSGTRTPGRELRDENPGGTTVLTAAAKCWGKERPAVANAPALGPIGGNASAVSMQGQALAKNGQPQRGP
jgi:hypothetical protein